MSIKIAQLNVRSLIPHFVEVVQFINDEEFDIFCVTETWLSDDVDSVAVQIPGYRLYRSNRRGNVRRGGVAIYVSTKRNFLITEIDTVDTSLNIEQLWLKIKIKKRTLAVGVIYRPEGNRNTSGFIEYLDELLSNIIPIAENTVLTGDMNIDLFDLDNPLSRCLSAYSFTQIIAEATRITSTSETLIDPMFLSDASLVSSHGTLNADLVADHRLVYCSLNYDAVKNRQKTLLVRDFRRLSYDNFMSDLTILRWEDIIYLNDIDEKVNFFIAMTSLLFDKHAPARIIRVSKPKAPWLTDTIKTMMRVRDKALQRYRNTKRDTDWLNYKNLRNFTLYAIRREKKHTVGLYSIRPTLRVVGGV